MKKYLVISLSLLLTGCSYFQSIVEKMNTDTLHYQCDEGTLVVRLNNQKQQVQFLYGDNPLILTQGISASGARYSDGIYVFWSKGDGATVYHKDNIVLNNCQLKNSGHCDFRGGRAQ